MHLEILARAIGPILCSIALSKAIFLYLGGGGGDYTTLYYSYALPR